jgi:putative cardiolipin synthase
MRASRSLLLGLCWLVLGACSHISRQETRQAEDYAEQARSSAIACPADCAIASPLLDLGDAAFAVSTAEQPRHKVVLLDRGQDSLLARVHLIRAARRSIDLQIFHFARDDSGKVVLDELLAAVGRGVKVRVLMDQLNGLADPELQAKLTSYHHNFELRVYNPIFLQAEVSPFEFAGGVLFRFRDLNRRMHNKMMVVDDRVAVIGGRNIQDEYFDWHETYNYRDRDLLVAGPECLAMKANFEVFWSDKRALPPSELADVARVLLQHKGPPDGPLPPRSARVVAMAAAAAQIARVFARLSPCLL